MHIIPFLLDSINFLFYKIKKSLEELKTYFYYTTDYKTIIDKFLNYIENLHIQYEKKKSNFTNLKENDYFNNFEINHDVIYSILSDLSYLHLIIKYLKSAKDFNVHQSIFILLRNYTIRISDSSVFILIPLFSYNYSYDYLTKDLINIANDLNINDIMYFAIPYLNQTDIFASALLAHEIGHYLICKYLVEERNLDVKCEFDKEIVNKEIPEKKKTDNKIEEAKKKEWIIDRWREEFSSDLIGLNLFGLPFFFAFVEFAFMVNPQENSTEKYPPYWLRLQFLINEIETMKIYSTFEKLEKELKINKKNYSQEILKRITFIKEKIKNLEQDAKEPIEFKDIIETIKKDNITYNEINQKVIEYLNDYQDKKYDYNDDNVSEIVELIKLLDEYIVPNEIINKKSKSGEISFNSGKIINILNAGWFYLIINIEQHYEIFNIDKIEDISKKEEKKMEIRQKLNELILKGIELSNIKTEYEKKKSEYKKKKIESDVC